MPGRAKWRRGWSVGFNLAIDGPASTLDAIAAVTEAARGLSVGGHRCDLTHLQANEKTMRRGPYAAVLPGDLILPGMGTLDVMAAAEAQAKRELAGELPTDVEGTAESDVTPSYAITCTLSIPDPLVTNAGHAVAHARRLVDRLTESGIACHVVNVNATRESPDVMDMLPDVARTIGRAMNKGVDGEKWKDDDEDDPDEGPAD
jgi:hypothetical protein